MKKKTLFAILSILFVTSCSNENFEQEQEVSTKVSTSSTGLRSASGPFRTLGFGYDITGEYLSKESVRRPVIDVDKMNSETQHRIISDTETGGVNNFYYGASSLDYIKEISKNTGFSASMSGLDIDKLQLCGFGASFSYNTEFKSKYSYSSKYSFASVDITRKVHSFRIEDKVSNYSKYVTKEFLADLNNYTPDEFVKYYGTHVLTHIELGGLLKIIYRSNIAEETNYEKKKQIVKAGINAALAKVGLKTEVDKDKQIEETLTTKNQEEKIYIDYKSGDGVGGVYDLSTGKFNNLDKYTWEKSVNLQTAGLIKINWEETHPIYDFIENPTKKALIKVAVEKYIKSKQLKVLNLKPLYRFYSSKNKDTFYTYTWERAQEHINKYNDSYESIDGYILAEPTSGTKPLYRMYSNTLRNTYFIYDWALVETRKTINKDSYEGLDGYILINPEENTLPFYGMFSNTNRDTYYITDWALVQTRKAKNKDSGGGIEGYIYE